MRFQQYLTEKIYRNDISFEELKDIRAELEATCMPWLKEMHYLSKGTKHRKIYRGKMDFNGGIEKFSRRKDRKPRNTDPTVHTILDLVFLELFGWRARSEGVFTHTSPDTAVYFGMPGVFFPIGKYEYLYSEKVSDLTMELEKENVLFDIDDSQMSIDFKKLDSEERYKEIKRIIEKQNYKEKGLYNTSISLKSEIMFNCDSYYLVDGNIVHDIFSDWFETIKNTKFTLEDFKNVRTKKEIIGWTVWFKRFVEIAIKDDRLYEEYVSFRNSIREKDVIKFLQRVYKTKANKKRNTEIELFIRDIIRGIGTPSDEFRIWEYIVKQQEIYSRMLEEDYPIYFAELNSDQKNFVRYTQMKLSAREFLAKVNQTLKEFK